MTKTFSFQQIAVPKVLSEEVREAISNNVLQFYVRDQQQEAQDEGITALYERLSQEDKLEGESNSIANQKKILERYCREHGITAYRHYDEDDGYSGTNFNRPGFQRMLADIKAGKIKRVIVKDMLKFALTEPTLIYRSKITNDGNIITDVFPSKNNTYSDVLLPLSSYSGSTTISVANIKNVIKKYSPSARVNGLNKEKLLQLLEDIRKTNNITNADLCNKFADEIYLPKIVLKKADIPLSLRSQFIDLR